MRNARRRFQCEDSSRRSGLRDAVRTRRRKYPTSSSCDLISRRSIARQSSGSNPTLLLFPQTTRCQSQAFVKTEQRSPVQLPSDLAVVDMQGVHQPRHLRRLAGQPSRRPSGTGNTRAGRPIVWARRRANSGVETASPSLTRYVCPAAAGWFPQRRMASARLPT